MRELTYFVAVSLDGFIAGPSGDFSAFPAEGDHIDMIVRDYPDTLPAHALKALGISADGSRFDTVVMGWNTYAVGLLYGVNDPYPHLRQYVVSGTRTPDDVPSSITLVNDHPVDTVRALKAEEGGSGIWLCGGGRLAASLFDQIDRLVLKLNPVVLGDGIRLVERSYDPSSFKLVASTPYRSGVVVLEYERR